MPRVRTKHSQAQFQFYATKIWNSLLEDVIQTSTLTMLKHRLKTVYRSCAYDSVLFAFLLLSNNLIYVKTFFLPFGIITNRYFLHQMFLVTFIVVMVSDVPD